MSLAISINFSVPSFGASEALRNWHGKNHKWLELSDVHRETTESIRVTVIPFFMGSRVSKVHMFEVDMIFYSLMLFVPLSCSLCTAVAAYDLHQKTSF